MKRNAIITLATFAASILTLASSSAFAQTMIPVQAAAEVAPHEIGLDVHGTGLSSLAGYGVALRVPVASLFAVELRGDFLDATRSDGTLLHEIPVTASALLYLSGGAFRLYVLAGLGLSFQGQGDLVHAPSVPIGQIGAGIEFRALPMLGIYADARAVARIAFSDPMTDSTAQSPAGLLTLGGVIYL